ncbi:Ribokinase [Paenibacillus plantiphilus]|uniref:Sucrose-6-phosphate hydrolase n=1 Tax=Paenibacillus plantiphilus TaxID=2905650 RepID=A0ABM9CMH0_9BACL|nr:sucrose-6-phosphate hydrolase [Paenibacillus plantiphilus]CAH1216424.1 Ribokinase [Paenibacillus plantiphilus]
MTKVVSIGEVLIDFVAVEAGKALSEVGEFKRAAGGAPANVACGIAKLGGQAYMISKLGEDSFGEYLLKTLRDVGVHTEYIGTTSEAKTALAFVSLTADGDRDFEFYGNPSADQLLSAEDIQENWFHEGDLMSYGSISLISDSARAATKKTIELVRKKEGLCCFDPNIRLSLWPQEQLARERVLEFLPFADVVKISEEEVVFLTGLTDEAEAVRKLMQGNVQLVLVTKGDKGCTAYTHRHQVNHPGYVSLVVDTTGAGDAFFAGVLYQLWKTGVKAFPQVLVDQVKLLHMISLANACGSVAVSRKGAINALPTLAQVEEILQVEIEQNEKISNQYTLEKANAYISGHPIDPDIRWRLNYHIMAPVGWINDPNGLIHYKDDYHVFYQYYPYGAEWGPMHWGHAKSSNLVNWEHMPVALSPDQSYEKGCFSGSAVEHDGKLLLYYTSHDHGRNPKEVQSMAVSEDGIHFVKPKSNPVVKNDRKQSSEDFRDPKVWKHEGLFYMAIGTSKNNAGRVVLYKSHDGEDWEFFSVAAESANGMGDMWECPDLFPLGDKYVLMISPMNMKNGKNIFMVGDFDYGTGRFTMDHYAEADYGRDFYAGQTFLDKEGRRIVVGWMDMWGAEMPTQKDGWAGAMTIPRELTLSASGNVLVNPVQELELLRGEQSMYSDLTVSGNSVMDLPDLNGDALEIICEFDTKAMNGGSFGFYLRKSANGSEYSSIYYSFTEQMLIADLEKAGKGDKIISKAPLPLAAGGTLKLHIFIDKSSIEVFANDGEVALSSRVYPHAQSNGVQLFSEQGEIRVTKLQAWKLGSIW